MTHLITRNWIAVIVALPLVAGLAACGGNEGGGGGPTGPSYPDVTGTYSGT